MGIMSVGYRTGNGKSTAGSFGCASRDTAARSSAQMTVLHLSIRYSLCVFIACVAILSTASDERSAVEC